MSNPDYRAYGLAFDKALVSDTASKTDPRYEIKKSNEGGEEGYDIFHKESGQYVATTKSVAEAESKIKNMPGRN